MAKRRLADWLKSYMEYTAPLEAPDEFHFWTGVSTIAGALRRQVWIDQEFFQWTPNFYIVLVAPPGISTKSTTVDVGIRFLRSLPDVAFGPNVVTIQALITTLAEGTTSVLMPDNQYHQMSCITCVSRELGSFLDPDDRLMIDVLTDLWDGNIGSWKKATKSAGNDNIENPWINIIAATTPSWLGNNMEESAIGGGFMSRCVFVYADYKRHYASLPKYHQSKPSPQLRADLEHDLQCIGMLRGEFNFTPEAVVWMDQWYRAHWQTVTSPVNGDRLDGYRARKQTHILKLAMVLSAAESDDLMLTQEILEKALLIVEATERHQAKVFNNIGQSDAGRHTQMLYEIVKRAGVIERHLLLRALVRVLDEKSFAAALTTAISARLVTQFAQNGKILIIDNAKLPEAHDVKQPNAKVSA